MQSSPDGTPKINTMRSNTIIKCSLLLSRAPSLKFAVKRKVSEYQEGVKDPPNSSSRLGEIKTIKTN